jgi:hypothetical protein
MATKIHAVPPEDDGDGGEESDNQEQFEEERPDPLNPDLYRVSGPTVQVEAGILAVPVRKPNKQEFVRVHPDPAYTRDVELLEFTGGGGDKDLYLVAPQVRPMVSDDMRPYLLHTTISRDKVLFLWQVRITADSNDGGRRWSQTALAATAEAKELWIKLLSNRALGGYEIVRAVTDHGDPKWPDLTFSEIFAIAFRDKLIDNVEHPVVKKITGEL